MAEHTVETKLQPKRVMTGAVALAIGFAAFAGLAIALDGGGGKAKSVATATRNGTTAGVGVFDSFQRADAASGLGVSDNGAQWRAITGGWGVKGGQAYVSRKAPFVSVVLSPLGSADGYVQVAASTVESGCGLVVRFHDRLNYVALVAVPKYATWNLEEVVAGKTTTIGNVGVAPVRNGTVIAVRVTGATAEVNIDNRPVKSFTVHQVPGAAEVGLIATGPQASLARWDDFVATPQVAATPSTTASSSPTSAAK
jgi:hypothetical protein